MADDLPFYETFFGIHVDDWEINFGSFASHHKLLVKEYISDACSTTSNSTATDTYKFIYPHHIKKTYFVEGVIQGHVTFAASTCTANIKKYRVTLCKVHQDTTETELFSTDWVTVNDNLYPIDDSATGDEIVYPYWIDAWEKEELTEYERLYVKVQTDVTSCVSSGCSCALLFHSNDANWEDIKIEIPFRGL